MANQLNFCVQHCISPKKWLRETKNLHIEITYIYRDYWTYDILTIPNHGSIGLSGRPLVHYKKLRGSTGSRDRRSIKTYMRMHPVVNDAYLENF